MTVDARHTASFFPSANYPLYADGYHKVARAYDPMLNSQQPDPPIASADVVLDFWFSERVRALWFQSTPAFDAELCQRFVTTWQVARSGLLDDWADTGGGALALVIVLDQFPLNMYRGQSDSFATEAAARNIARRAIESGVDRQIDNNRRAFLYLPFMHSEALSDQEYALQLFAQPGLEGNLKWARHHRDIVQRFGRFPHRNAIIGRASTAEEIVYLASEGSYRG